MKKMSPLSRTELLLVLDAAYASSRRDHAILLLSFCHGLRVSECAALKVSDINTKDWTIRVARAKGSKTTVQLLAPNADKLLDERKTLTEWLAQRPVGSDYLFPSRSANKDGDMRLHRSQIYRVVRRYAEMAELAESKRGHHVYRHSLGQMLADGGTDIARVAAALGHRSYKSSEHYFTISDAQADVERLKAIGSVV